MWSNPEGSQLTNHVVPNEFSQRESIGTKSLISINTEEGEAEYRLFIHKQWYKIKLDPMLC